TQSAQFWLTLPRAPTITRYKRYRLADTTPCDARRRRLGSITMFFDPAESRSGRSAPRARASRYPRSRTVQASLVRQRPRGGRGLGKQSELGGRRGPHGSWTIPSVVSPAQMARTRTPRCILNSRIRRPKRCALRSALEARARVAGSFSPFHSILRRG